MTRIRVPDLAARRRGATIGCSRVAREAACGLW
jgi:hypothetical protein